MWIDNEEGREGQESMGGRNGEKKNAAITIK